MDDIKHLLQQFQEWDIKHIYREGNKAAEWVANVGHLVNVLMCIDHLCSPQLLKILCIDRLGIPLERRGLLIFFSYLKKKKK